MTRLAVLVHLLAVAFWVGGMAFAHFALRPALAETLDPPQRLTVLMAILQRFLAGVALAILLILASGGYLMGNPGAATRPAVHAMIAIGVVMVLVFVYIRLKSYAQLRDAVAAKAWPAAGAAAATIRRLVALNLALGTVVIAVVALWQ